MKTFNTGILFLVVTASIFSENVMAGSTLFTVNGMVCAFCAQGIEKKLKAMPETAAVYIDLAQKIVAVEAKEGKVIASDKITDEIKEAGYDVSKVEETDKTVAEIQQAMEKAHEK